MGNKVPVPDERLQKMIDMIQLEKRQLAQLWKVFQKYDKDSSGTIDVTEFYKMIEEDQSVFGDSVFELVDIDNSGTLDFSEFVQVLGTYCLFGRLDILKFCFFVFDKDENGYVDSDELHALIEMLHGNNPSSNCRTALSNFDQNNDGKIDFEEFQALNVQFPMLLFPAFRMQENMMSNTLGAKWWKEKKAMLQQQREEANSVDEKLRLKELQRQHRNQQRQVKYKMGFLAYYLCFFKRGKVLSQIAAEEALRAEKRDKKNALKEKQTERKNNRKDLENLFKDTDKDKKTDTKKKPVKRGQKEEITGNDIESKKARIIRKRENLKERETDKPSRAERAAKRKGAVK